MDDTEQTLEAMVEAYCDRCEKQAQVGTMIAEHNKIKRLLSEIDAINAKILEKLVPLRRDLRFLYMDILRAIPQDGTVRVGPFVVVTGPLDDGTRGLWITDTRLPVKEY